jgi:hypothetical protein
MSPSTVKTITIAIVENIVTACVNYYYGLQLLQTWESK